MYNIVDVVDDLIDRVVVDPRLNVIPRVADVLSIGSPLRGAAVGGAGRKYSASLPR
jgi:hypothetical protein